MSDIPMPQGLTQSNDSYTQQLISEVQWIKNYIKESPLVKENLNLLKAIEKNTSEEVENNSDFQMKQENSFSSFFKEMNKKDKIPMRVSPVSSIIPVKKEQPDSKKEESKISDQDKKETKNMFSDFFKSFKETTKQVFSKSFDLGFQTLLGPLNIIANPLQELGIDFNSGFRKVGELITPKPFKGAPKRNKILKIDPGAVYLADVLAPDKEDKDKEKLSKMLSGFGIKGGMGKIFGNLLKGGAIALIIGGLVWAGINAFQGWVASQKWGTSKISGAIGGFLAGTDSGWKGAFKNFGKWALIGAGTGFLVAGPVGAIVGGLIGASVGAILGFIGGETIAKGVDKLKSDMTTLWKDGEIKWYQKLAGSVWLLFDGFLNAFSTFWATIPTMIYSIFEKDKKKQKMFMQISKEVFKFLGNIGYFMVGWIVDGITSFGTAFKKMQDKKDEKNFVKKVGGFVKDFITEFLIRQFNRFVRPLTRLGSLFFNETKIGNVIKKIATTMGDKIKSFFTGIFGKIIGKKNLKKLQTAISDPFGTVMDLFNMFKIKISSFFRTINDFFDYINRTIEDKGVVKGLGSVAIEGAGGLKKFKVEKYAPQAEQLISEARRQAPRGDTETRSLAMQLEKAVKLEDPKALLNKMDELILVMQKKGFNTTVINNDNRYSVGSRREPVPVF
jgi:hypothetical protein